MEENEVTQNVVEEKKGLSIASMVLGIVGIVLSCIWYISIPCAILAIIFGLVGRKKGAKGMATAGLVLGIISIALDILIVVGVIAIFETALASL